MSEFEEILEDIGSFGPLQIQVFILVSMFETPAAWGLFLHPVFDSQIVPWTCNSPGGGNNQSGETTTSWTLPANTSDGSRWDMENCSLYNTNQCMSVQFEAQHTSIISEWNLICDWSHISGLITFLQMFGVLVGACVTGQLADIFGRKRVLFAVYAAFLLLGLASAFANSWILFMALRILIGMCFGGVMVVNFVLPLEFVGARWRTFCGCVGFWACGLMSVSLLAYLIPNWRHLTLTCFAGGLPLLATWWFIPESPRWLLLQNRQEEAESILRDIARRNKRPVPDLSKLDVFVQNEKQRKKAYKQYSYWDLCRNFPMTKNTSVILYAWFVSSSVYYGTTLGAKHLHGNKYLNFFLSGLVEIPALIYVVLVNNVIGRRKTLTTLMNLAGLSCIAVLLINMYAPEMYWLSLTFALIGKSGISGSWAAVQVSSAEIFPTVVRNIGIGASSMAARVGLLIAPEIANLADFHISIPYLIFGILGVSCGLLCLLLPETLNQPLPDTLPDRTLCSCCVPNKGERKLSLTNGVNTVTHGPSAREMDVLLDGKEGEAAVKV